MSKKKKLFLFVENFLINSDYKKFRLNIFRKYFNICVYDFTYYSTPLYYKKYKNYFRPHLLKEIKVKIIKKNQLNKIINIFKKSKKKLFIIDALSNNKSLLDFKIVLSAIKNIYFINLSNVQIPSHKEKYSLQKLSLRNIKTILVNYFHFKKYLLYDYFFIYGKKAQDVRCKNIIYGKSPDYEEFLKVGNKKNTTARFAVFLDEMMPDHPDYYKLNILPPIKSNEYYNILNNFFDWFEKKNKIKIKILLHPKNLTKKNLFRGRILVKDQTAYFVKKSQYVILHSSTSVAFGVLWKKPLIYLSLPSLGWINPRIHEFHSQTGGTLVDLSSNYKENFETNIFNKVDDKKYNEYINNFVKHSQSPKNYFRLFLRNIIND